MLKEPLPLHSRRTFLVRFARNLTIGILATLFCLGIGMWGYHHFEHLNWIDAYLNAAMILSGMGPVNPVQSTEGKLFAGTYALFSGIVFLVIVGIIFAPIFHRFFHKFHIEEFKQK
jgi:cellobiose-specific phosphotransferase system component IIC